MSLFIWLFTLFCGDKKTEQERNPSWWFWRVPFRWSICLHFWFIHPYLFPLSVSRNVYHNIVLYEMGCGWFTYFIFIKKHRTKHKSRKQMKKNRNECMRKRCFIVNSANIHVFSLCTHNNSSFSLNCSFFRFFCVPSHFFLLFSHPFLCSFLKGK